MKRRDDRDEEVKPIARQIEQLARAPLYAPRGYRTGDYRASRELARVGFLYLRFLTIQLQQAHPPTVDAHELHRVALTRHLNEILRGVAF